MNEPARTKAVGIMGSRKLRQLEEAGLTVVYREDWDAVVNALKRIRNDEENDFKNLTGGRC